MKALDAGEELNNFHELWMETSMLLKWLYYWNKINGTKLTN